MTTRRWLLLVPFTFACGGSDGPTVPPGPPQPPFTVSAAVVSATAIRLTWTAVTGATGYLVQRSAAGLPTVRTPAATLALDDANLSPSTTYQYSVATVRGTDTSTYSTAVVATTRSVGATAAYLRGDITASRTLAADTQYIISGFVKVKSGATLTIAAGTKLVGDSAVVGSSLWITRGAKLVARGSASNPIVFTSQRAAGARAPGDWGGVVIVGNAPSSRTTAEALTYGHAGTAQAPEIYGGGALSADDSGVLSYVRIEFAGAAPAPGDDQMAGLTLYAVGRGTTLEFVQTLESLGAGIAWYGGTVDGRNLVSYEAGDDLFAWSEGYSGRNQFVIGYQTHQPLGRPNAGLPSSTPRGFQGYGCDVGLAGCASYLAAPYSEPVFANFTLVGPGPGVYASTVASQANGIMLRRGTGGTFLNGVAARWPSIGLTVREQQTDSLRIRDSLFIAGVLLTDNAGGNLDAVGGAGYAFPGTFPSITSATALTATLFASLSTLDWTPATGSALRSGAFTTWPTRVTARTTAFFGGSLTATSYVGAADPSGAQKWWEGWTAYARN